MLLGPDFDRLMGEIAPQAKVLPATAFREAWKRRRSGLDKPPTAASLPWEKTHGLVGLRPGEVTLWAGENGSGKSLVTSQVALSLIAQQHRVVVASMEMRPMRQLERFERQFSGCQHPTDQAADAMFDAMHGRLWFYDQQHRVTPKQIRAVGRYGAEKHGMSHLVIDNLMKCVRAPDDYAGQKDFVDELTLLARDLDVHVHLVHHLSKQKDDTVVPTKADAKGAGEITDLVDNVFLWWRNRPKERAQAVANDGRKLSDRQQESLEGPDAVLVVDKQRNGDWEGRVRLWYHAGALQFVGSDSRRPIDYMAQCGVML